MPLRPVPRALALALVLRAAAVHASGLGIPDLGANAIAQGSANVAAPSDLSAIYYNPAALALTPGLRFMFDVRRVTHQLTFQRLDENGQNPSDFPKVTNAGPPALAPIVALAYQFTPKDLFPVAFAIGAHPASGYSGYIFPDPNLTRAALGGDGFDPETARLTPQRYALITQNSLSYTIALSLAAQLADWASVGVSFQSPYVQFRSTQAINANSKSNWPDESNGWDAVLKIDATDPYTLTGALGASFKLPHGIALGLAFQLPATILASGTLGTELGAVLKAAKVKQIGNSADVEVHLPWIARLGARLVRPRFEVELAFTLDGWSQYDEVIIHPHDIALDQDGTVKKLSDIHLEKGLTNAVSARLGGLFRLGELSAALEPFSVRAGALYETSAVPVERTSIDLAHTERLSLGGGLAMKLGSANGLAAGWRDFEFALSYAHFIQPDRQVRTSTVKQARPSKPDQASIIGNGDYSSQIDLVGFSLSGGFD